MEKIKVLLADDHTVVREGFKALLNNSGFIEVAREASDGEMVLSRLHDEHFDLVVSDITMPRMGGVELCSQLKRKNPGMPVLLLTMHSDKEYVSKAIEAGASGYLMKDCEKEELYLAIKKIASGSTYFSSQATSSYTETEQRKPEQLRMVTELTKREQEILQLVMDGLPTKHIAEKLYISIRTVDKHRANIMEKFNVHSTVELINYVLRNKTV